MKKVIFLVAILLETVVATSQPINIDLLQNGDIYYVCGSSQKIYSNTCHSNNEWNDGVNIFYDLDTLVVGGNHGTQKEVLFRCTPGGTWKMIYIRFHSATPATTIQPLYTVCGEAVNIPINIGPGNQYADVLWSTGATIQNQTITALGSYFVSISNGCGGLYVPFDVVYSNPNRPNLGPDTTLCLSGTPLTLDPHMTGQGQTLWSTGAQTPTIDVTQSGTYWVYAADNNGCDGRDTISVTVIVPESIEMCYVTFDTITWKNQVVWYVDPAQTDIDSVRVEVKNQLGQWISIGTVLYTDGSLLHVGSNPQQDFNEYRIVSIGACGQGTYSQIHRSIWLSTFANELQWQNYYGTFVPAYYIVFAMMNNGSTVPIDTVPSCSGAGCLNHSPIITNPNVVKYFVAFQENCSSNKNNVWVRSNYWDILTSTEEMQKEGYISIFPNPTTGSINIAGVEGNSQIDVYDFSGRLILHVENQNNIDLTEFSRGTYFVKVITENGVLTEKVIRQ